MRPISLLALLFTFALSQLAAADGPRCFRELQEFFFDWEDVSEALSLNNIDQGIWTPIVRDLKRRMGDVPNRMRQRGREMRRDPMRRPFQREAAFALLRQVLFEIYSDVLISNGVSDFAAIDRSFALVWQKQESRINRCYQGSGAP